MAKRTSTAAMLLALLGCVAPTAQAFDIWQAARLVKMLDPGSESGRERSTGQTEVSLPRGNGTFAACLEHFANGVPPRVPNADARRAKPLCFNGFAVLHSGQTKTPIYAAAVLNRDRILAARKQERTNIFFADARLPARERANLDDYRGSGFDRGHNVPAADLATAHGVAQSFSLANMMPQAPKNNQGQWADIEQATRKYILRAKGDVYVFTGSLLLPGECQYALPNCQIGSGVTVPSHIFKLVYDPSTERAWAHWLPNRDDARASKPIRYEELVARTGIEFLPGINPRN